MNKFRKLLYYYVLFDVCLVFLFGCNNNDSIEKKVLIALNEKYNEDFVIKKYDDCSNIFVSPVKEPDIVFNVKINEYDIIEDDYPDRYMAKYINDILVDDLKCFFPSAYIRTEVHPNIPDIIVNGEKYVNKPLNQILIYDEGYGHMNTYIYIDKDVGTYKKFEEEYYYFNEKIDEYCNENLMYPITIRIYKVDSDCLKKLDEYFKEDLRENGYFENNILDVSYFIQNDLKNEGIGSNLGDPPNISACFDDNYIKIDSVNEYIRRRELLENE